VDEIVPEPNGGAHDDHPGTAALLDRVLVKALQELKALTPEERIEKRYQRFRVLGPFCDHHQK
jgi:acetyl-CoA carboxylase carboxyl transferase subunit alpha